jgi:YVTN family beta-propeller protein
MTFSNPPLNRRTPVTSPLRRVAQVTNLLLALLCIVPPSFAQEKQGSLPSSREKWVTPAGPINGSLPPSQEITREGISVEFTIVPVGDHPKGTSNALPEGASATVTFRIRDTATKMPVTGLRPAAWLNIRGQAGATDSKSCRDKVQSFLQASFSARPSVDLNKYYILALNQEPNISVIDPLLGVGATKLLTLVMLKSPGADWVMSADQRWLYVSMPLVNQVAIVDTETWKVAANVDAGIRPSRLRLQRDGKYLWIGTDGTNQTESSGVNVLDTATRRVVAQIPTGAGHHDVEISMDDRYAFVTNQHDGTLTVIETARLAQVKSLKTGEAPIAVNFSTQGRAVYIAHESDGSIVAVDATRHEITSRIMAKPGLVALQFTPNGRYGFAVNRKESVVQIIDSATNHLLHTIPVGPAPDQVSFTRQFAYVRSLGSEEVTMIRLAEIGRTGIEQATSRFPGGQQAPQLAGKTIFAPAVVNAPESGAVLVANPADQMIYYYTEGMAAPMGNFRNYRRQPLALAVWDASLRESEPGVYRTTTRLPSHGSYDVAFLLDSPRIVNCFDAIITENPDYKKKMQVPIKVEPLAQAQALTVGKKIRLRFKVTDALTGQLKPGLKDLGVLTFLAPGIWQQRDWAQSVGEGVYEVSVTPPREGVYYIFFQCPSLGIQYRQLPHLIRTASRQSPASGAAMEKPGDAAVP